MYKLICDLCGEPIESPEKHSEFKIKKRWYSWWESGWDRIDAHDECVKAVAAAARERSEDANG